MQTLKNIQYKVERKVENEIPTTICTIRADLSYILSLMESLHLARIGYDSDKFSFDFKLYLLNVLLILVSLLRILLFCMQLRLHYMRVIKTILSLQTKQLEIRHIMRQLNRQLMHQRKLLSLHLIESPNWKLSDIDLKIFLIKHFWEIINIISLQVLFLSRQSELRFKLLLSIHI